MSYDGLYGLVCHILCLFRFLMRCFRTFGANNAYSISGTGQTEACFLARHIGLLGPGSTPRSDFDIRRWIGRRWHMVGLRDWGLPGERNRNLALAPGGLGPRGEENSEEIVLRCEYAKRPGVRSYSTGRE